MILESIGWLGAFFFAICGAPQAYESYKNKNSDGIAIMFVILWLLGEIFMLAYVALQPELSLPLIANYIGNLGIVAIIIYYKIYPTRELLNAD